MSNSSAGHLAGVVAVAAWKADAGACVSRAVPGGCRLRCADRRAALQAAREAAAAFGVADAGSLRLEHRPGAPPISVLPASHSHAPPPVVSIAHTRGRAIAAVAAPGARLGVDLAEAGSVAAPHTAYFCAQDEPGDELDATTRWVLKEAAWKALRLTPDTPFAALRLDVSSNGEVRGAVLHGQPVPAHVRVWHPWDGWIAALTVLQGPAPAWEAA